MLKPKIYKIYDILEAIM